MTINNSGVTSAVALHISKAFDRSQYDSLLHTLKSWLYGLILSFLTNGQLQFVLDEKLLQDYPVRAERV